MTVGLDASTLSGIASWTVGSGNAGKVAVSVGDLSILNNGLSRRWHWWPASRMT